MSDSLRSIKECGHLILQELPRRHLQRQRHAALPGRPGRQSRQPAPRQLAGQLPQRLPRRPHAVCRLPDDQRPLDGCPPQYEPLPLGTGRQRQWPAGLRRRPGRRQFHHLILYDDFNFSGRTLQLTGPAPDLRAYNFDRRTSSLRVQGNWYVCSGINYTGECTKVAGAFNASGKWNDRISSARPY